MKTIDNISGAIVGFVLMPLLIILYAILVLWWITKYEFQQIARKFKKKLLKNLVVSKIITNFASSN